MIHSVGDLLKASSSFVPTNPCIKILFQASWLAKLLLVISYMKHSAVHPPPEPLPPPRPVPSFLLKTSSEFLLTLGICYSPILILYIFFLQSFILFCKVSHSWGFEMQWSIDQSYHQCQLPHQNSQIPSLTHPCSSSLPP